MITQLNLYITCRCMFIFRLSVYYVEKLINLHCYLNCLLHNEFLLNIKRNQETLFSHFIFVIFMILIKTILNNIIILHDEEININKLIHLI